MTLRNNGEEIRSHFSYKKFFVFIVIENGWATKAQISAEVPVDFCDGVSVVGVSIWVDPDVNVKSIKWRKLIRS